MAWLPDLRSWADTVSRLLEPGGVFFVRDAHPVLSAVDFDRHDGQLVLNRPYFSPGHPLRYDTGTTYADDSAHLEQATTYEWQHPLSEIVQSLLDVGLRLRWLGEHRTLPWRALPQMDKTPNGFSLRRDGLSLPLAFSLVASKPKAE